MLLTCK